MSADAKKALAALKRKLGSGIVLTDEASLFGASFDGMKHAHAADARIVVTAAEQVGDVLKLANKHRIPVTTRGAGSSLTGSASPRHGGWVLDVSKLNKIKIDSLAQMATVGAGAVLAKIQQAAEKKGLFYAPDPSSVKFCTIGGTIACNAGGLRGAKYGVTRDYVISLKGYLPTGEPMELARPLRKWAVGYNLRDLMIGSEGTLGVITEATVKLLPKPVLKRTALAAFKTEEAALKAVRVLLETRMVPVALEFLDRTCIKGLEKALGKAVFESCPGAAILLVEVDGNDRQIADQMAVVGKWQHEHAVDYRVAETDAEAEALWDVRRGCSPAMFAHGNTKLNEDIIVPLRAQVPLMRFIRKMVKETGVPAPTFGHAADGNFHVNIMYYREDKAMALRAQKAVGYLMEKVVELGGAISGEHGIGLAKTPFFDLQIGKAEREAMLSIKKSLDPNGILNPGKIFDIYKPWEHEPVNASLPWDHKRLET